MIDIEELAQNLGFDVEDAEVLVELFVEGAQVSLANIEDALSEGDIATIAKEAHAIKGSAANLMLVDIQDIAREMENAAKEGRKINFLSLYSQLDEKIEKISEVELDYA